MDQSIIKMEEMVGKTVQKEFTGLGTISGTVKSYEPSFGYFEILYEDGDSEEIEFPELVSILLNPSHQIGFDSGITNYQQIDQTRPKKKRRCCDGSFSGNSVVSTCIPSQEQTQTLASQKSTTKPTRDLDLNVALPEEEEEEQIRNFVPKLDEVVKVEDASFSTPTGIKTGGGDMDMMMGDSCFETEPEDRDLGGILRNCNSAYAQIICPQPPDKHQVVVEQQQQQQHVGRRKRRRVSNKMNATTTTQTTTVLRRSTRRPSSVVCTDNNLTPCRLKNPAVSFRGINFTACELNNAELTVEKELPPKLELPPSSTNLNIEDSSILDLFSIYSFLRSFSTFLFLSPFELEYFAEALKYKFPNSLIDSIHYCLLQTLKLHLEVLSDEGSQSASTCLRNLNWAFLDVVTWPMYLVEYFLIRGSGSKPCLEISQLRLLINDYYKQSPALKIEILRCLCDDVMESESIRLELNRRAQACELDMDADRIANIEINKKRKDMMDDGGSCLTQEVVDETADGNSDECCLCRMDGSLICCDGCPAAYHTRCVGITKDQLPEGDWYCPECLSSKYNSGKNISKSFRGAEILGGDPYGRQYFSCCGYLLVLNSCEPESSYHYYNSHDLKVVIDVLSSYSILYGGIISAILINWKIPVDSTEAQDHQNSQMNTLYKVLDLNSQVPFSETAEDTIVSKLYETLSEIKDVEMETVNHLTTTYSPREKCELLAEMPQVGEAKQPYQRTEMGYSNGYPGNLNKSETQEDTHFTGGDCSLTPTNYEVKQEKKQGSLISGRISVAINLGKGSRPQMQFDPSYYANYYDFARIAASIAQELLGKSLASIKEGSQISIEEIISAQSKAISKYSTNICWLNIHSLHQNEQTENCGWCFSCRTQTDSGDCLFNTCSKMSTLEGLNSGSVGLHSRRVKKSHLYAIICHILSIEERLSGLLLGPWQNPNYSKLWRKSVMNASDVTLVKHRLLDLESNLRRIALSAEWLKQVDAVIMGSATHVMTTSVPVSSSKHGGGRKRARLPDAEPNSASIGAARPGIFWWRGGRVSRQLFNCKVLPYSLASKGGRQAGWRKIPGVIYPDGLEFGKRSKYMAWRAAVEMSSSLPHLAFQVKELDSNIRWDDLENTQVFSHLSKESKKLMKLFKKVTIRRKRVEGSCVKYLLDFGKRKTIPDTVTRNGVMLEVSASERKKYWLDESLVPLHILKGYEEKKIARVSTKVKPDALDKGGKLMKRFSRKWGLSHLLSKVEKSDYYQCGHCKKDVLIREAVTCQDCEGFFHKRHVRKSEYISTSECTYSCHKCQDKTVVKKTVVKKSVKPKHKKRNPQSTKSKKPSLEGRPRRSVRKVYYMPVKSKKRGGAKKSKKVKPKKGQSKKSKKEVYWHTGIRTQVYHAYWLNGLRFTRQLNDPRAVRFADENIILPHSSANVAQPTCSICSEAVHRSSLVYIKCEHCQEWLHGAAFGLTAENSSSILGFQCHKCRKRIPPTCPYLDDTEVNDLQLQEEKSNAGDECIEDTSSIEEFRCTNKSMKDEFTSGKSSQGSPHGSEFMEQKKGNDLLNIITEEQRRNATSNGILREPKVDEISDNEHEEAHKILKFEEQIPDKLTDSSHKEQGTNGSIDSFAALPSVESKNKLEKSIGHVQEGKVTAPLNLFSRRNRKT